MPLLLGHNELNELMPHAVGQRLGAVGQSPTDGSGAETEGEAIDPSNLHILLSQQVKKDGSFEQLQCQDP